MPDRRRHGVRAKCLARANRAARGGVAAVHDRGWPASRRTGKISVRVALGFAAPSLDHIRSLAMWESPHMPVACSCAL